MYEKCQEIDRIIERYCSALRLVSDRHFTDRAEALIKKLEAQKAALHAE